MVSPRRRFAILVTVIGVWLLATVAFVSKLHGISHGPFAGVHQHVSWLPAWTDARPMWQRRGIGDHVFPYLHAQLIAPSTLYRSVEYPVLLGVIMWITALPVHSFGSFLALTTVLNAVAASGVALLLFDVVGKRALWWAWSPLLVLYLSYNWDALPALASVAGLWLVVKGPTAASWTPYRRAVLAAALFGVGCLLKLYPIIYLAPLVLWLVSVDESPTRLRCWRAVRVAGVGIAVVVAGNLPFALIGRSAWLDSFRFQGGRPINQTAMSLWYWWLQWWRADQSPSDITGAKLAQVTMLSLVVTVAVWCLVLWLGWRLKGPSAAYPIAAVSAAMTATYLAFGKIDSPQYAMWLLPLLLLTDLAWWAIAGYTFVNFTFFASYFAFAHDAADWPTVIAPTAVAVNVIALIAVGAFALRAERWRPSELEEPFEEQVRSEAAA